MYAGLPWYRHRGDGRLATRWGLKAWGDSEAGRQARKQDSPALPQINLALQVAEQKARMRALTPAHLE